MVRRHVVYSVRASGSRPPRVMTSATRVARFREIKVEVSQGQHRERRPLLSAPVRAGPASQPGVGTQCQVISIALL